MALRDERAGVIVEPAERAHRRCSADASRGRLIGGSVFGRGPLYPRTTQNGRWARRPSDKTAGFNLNQLLFALRFSTNRIFWATCCSPNVHCHSLLWQMPSIEIWHELLANLMQPSNRDACRLHARLAPRTRRSINERGRHRAIKNNQGPKRSGRRQRRPPQVTSPISSYLAICGHADGVPIRARAFGWLEGLRAHKPWRSKPSGECAGTRAPSRVKADKSRRSDAGTDAPLSLSV